MATIEELELKLDQGFSILTGETGAGKSIIIDGIRLVLGEKATPDVIRTGKKETSVEAIFLIPTSAQVQNKKSELFIQRKVSEESPAKGYLNGVLVPLKKLKEKSSQLADIYGQNDHAFLRQTDNQLDYLDYYAQAIPLGLKVSQLARELKKLARKKKELENKEKERQQQLDFLDWQIKEIEKAELKKGEEEKLLYERKILKNAAKILSLVETALEISYDQENSISTLLAKLENTVRELSSFDQSLQNIVEAINQFQITINDFSDFLIKFKDQQILSPEKLEAIEERLSLIEKLKRKYGQNIEEILLYLEKAKKEYQQLSTSQEKLEELNLKIDKKFKEYKTQAKKLSHLRMDSAQKLEKRIEQEIACLGMKNARFKIKIKTIPCQKEMISRVKEKGTEEVEFLISPNPGEALRPLRKIASGGELSRIMLVLKSIGKETERLKTLIFDEIDSGIGGKTAEYVARKLQALACQHQVICITHLPQIASFASDHYKIEKKIAHNRTYTTVKKLSFKERVVEIARLLAGSRITETALNNAREMLIHNLGLKPR